VTHSELCVFIDHVATELLKDVATRALHGSTDPACDIEAIRTIGGEGKGIALMCRTLKTELKKREDDDD